MYAYVEHRLVLWALLLRSVGAGACSDPHPASIETITIEPRMLSMQPGDSLFLLVRRESSGQAHGALEPTERGSSLARVEFGTSDTTIVRVRTDGLAFALRAGVAHVWAVASDQIAFADVVVGEALDDRYSVLSAGGAHTCGLRLNGRAYCWGSHWFGEGGRGKAKGTVASNSASPVAVESDLRFTDIDAGMQHTCGIAGPGIAYCWGNNFVGALGDGSKTDRDVPRRVATEVRFSSISAGANGTCAVGQDRHVYCWGRLVEGFPVAPMRVSAGLFFREVATGSQHVCSVSVDDLLFCWGNNDWGQLGGREISSSATPRRIAERIVSVAAGAYHTCAVGRSGEQRCWGMNIAGQLGGQSSPVVLDAQKDGRKDFTHLYAGTEHTCGATDEGTLYCWGSNWRGQLGTGHGFGRVSSPAVVSGNYRFARVSGGGEHSCGITTERLALCWGSNRAGQLGMGRIEWHPGTQLPLASSPVPVLVSASNVTSR